MSLLGTPIVRAETPTCEQVLSLCDEAVQEQKKQIEIRDLALTQTQDEIARQKGVIRDQEDKLNSVWRNPFLYLLLGVAAGVFIAK